MSPAVERATQIGLMVLVISLASWHLTSRPAPWYDEGVNMQAARNLARSGRYGLMYANEEPRLFDLQLTTGPTLIGPVALMFGAFGPGLRQARLVMLAYTLLSALGLYRLAATLYGARVAAVAVLILCAAEGAGPASTRAVVGEIAALAYLFWGALLFVRARRGGRWADDVAAGLLFGLAVLTKGQFGLLIPALIGVWLLTRRRASGFVGQRLTTVLTALVTLIALWQLVQLVSLGLPAYLEHQQEQRAALSVSANAPFLSQTLNTAHYLLSSQTALVGLMGLLYVLVAVGRRGAPAERLLLPWFAALWFVWYVGFSVGYERYAIPLIAVCTLFAAVLARDVLNAVGPWWRSLAGLGLGATLVWGIASQYLVLAQRSDSSAVQMGALMMREVESRASTESLEWELDALTDRAFHHPPPFVPAIPYAVPTSTRYLIDGPASKATELYVPELEQHVYEHVAGVGPYDLYRRRAAP
jgi:4-amino-4-deoxy-L-arabinose transferase-like glycosyltransferase